MEQQTNEKIIEIVHQANDMIPVEWDDLYINFEVDRTLSGEIYFFFEYNGEYHYFFYIPQEFGKSKSEFFEEYRLLFKKAQELKKVFMDNGLSDWSAGLIHLDENNKLSVDFDYAPQLESGFGPSARTSFFQYKYLGKQPANEKELEQFKAMETFQREHNKK